MSSWSRREYYKAALRRALIPRPEWRPQPPPPVEKPPQPPKPQTPVKKQSTPAPSPLRKPAVKRGKRKKPEKRKRVAKPTSVTLKLKPGKKQSAIWVEIILPHLDAIVENEGKPFASLGRARDAAKERLGSKKGLSDSAIERGIKRNRPHWFEQA